jgi:small-conductance mechanosensitive channel
MTFEQLSSNPWILVSAGVAISILFVSIGSALLIKLLRASSARTTFKLDTTLVRALPFPLALLSIALVIFVAQELINYTQVTEFAGSQYSENIFKVLTIMALIIFGDRFLQGVISDYSQNSEILKSGIYVIKGITKAFIYVIGIMILLGTLGISITPLLTSVGITSLAVALALRPTLENFFSGVQIVADKPFRIGDFIELDSGEQGFVEKIVWRSTWVRMLPNNTVIMPNSVLSQSKIINYFYPEK